jgi:protein required for attachment to host cells
LNAARFSSLVQDWAEWEDDKLDMAGELTTGAALQVDLTDINACHSVSGKISIAGGGAPMSKLQIPHDAFVFVGDGRKALFLRNDGDEKFPNLKTERVFVDENPPTREQGTDRPGRVFERAGTTVRSGVETTDWHDLEEHRFAQRAAAAMEKLVRQRKVKTLVIVAPPRALADLRHAFHADVKSRIIAEIGKDLTKHPVDEIEKHLMG